MLAVAAPAIAISARSSSHGVTPATVAHRKGDFRIAVVTDSTAPPCHSGTLITPVTAACVSLGHDLATADDVQSASARYDATRGGWFVEVQLARQAIARLRAAAPTQAAIVVAGKVRGVPRLNAGISGTAIDIVTDHMSREQAIALATQILGRPPSHVDAAPLTLSTSIDLPSDTIVAGSDLKGTLVVDNATGKPIDLSRGGCHPKFAVTLKNATFTNQPVFTSDCAIGPWMLAPGVTRWNFTLIGSYFGPRPIGSQSLPVGDYEAVLVTDTPGFLPDPTPVPVHVVAAPSTTPSLGALSVQTGKRSIKVLVPVGWTFVGQDAGGSGSGSTWTNPHDPNEKIEGVTGVEVGSWWETDGVAGSIHLPTGMLPAGAHIQRANYTTFLYQYTAANGNVIDGVWIAELDHGLPSDFVSAQVQLPPALQSTATTIINRFISDRKALLPPGTTAP